MLLVSRVVRRLQPDGYPGLDVLRDPAPAGQATQPQLMGWNEIIFGGLALIGIGAFFFFGRYRAGKAQREKANKPRWGDRGG